jgi:hypothetical protein
VFGVFKENIVFKTSRMNCMVGLLGNIGFMWRTAKVVSTSSEFINCMIFEGKLAVISGSVKSSEADIF